MNEQATHITIVLDRSGSMESVREDTIGGFNVFLNEQKAEPGQATLTLVQFDNEYEVVYDTLPLAKVPPLTQKTFQPRGSTALLDAIGRAMNETGKRLAEMPDSERPGKVLLVIMTDGYENASQEFTSEQIFQKITHQREVYSWQIVFIGANQDAIATGSSLGIAPSNSLNYVADSAGTTYAMKRLSRATVRSRSAPVAAASAPAPTEGFFDEDDEKPENGKA